MLHELLRDMPKRLHYLTKRSIYDSRARLRALEAACPTGP